jgi:tetratricopeptide (TPR) repeat protein
MCPSGSQGRSWREWLGLALLPLALLTVFFTGFHSVIDLDIWIHLRDGSQVVTGSIPRVDSLSYPSAGHPYVDLNWLFQLAAFLVYRLAGEPGLIWFACLGVTGAFALLYRLARRVAPPPLAAAVTVLGAILASERFSPRPEIFTFIFLGLVQWCLCRHREGWRPAWWTIPLIFVLWVNSEGVFVVGYALLGAALLDHPRDRRLWSALGLSLLAALANPFFLEGALRPFLLFTRVNQSLPIYSATIGELVRPFATEPLHPAMVLFPFYLGLLTLGLLACGRRLRRGEVLLLAVFVYLSCTARRNVALLAVIATPVLARWLACGADLPWIRRRWARTGASVRRGAALAAVGGLLLAMAAYDVGLATNRIYVRAGTNRRFGCGRAETDFPRGAARFLQERKIKGPIFSTFGAGSYFTWAYPGERVFIDGRLEVHSTAHYERYLAMLAGGPAWAAAETEFHFNAAVIQYIDAMALAVERLQDRSWAFVHLDDDSIVLVKRSEQNRAVIEETEVTLPKLYATYPALTPAQIDSSFVLPPPPSRSPLSCFRQARFPWGQAQLGQFFQAINRWDLAAGQFMEAVRLAPDQASPRVLLATTLNQMGRPRVALAVLESAESLGGSRELRGILQIVRGDILVGLDRPREAVAAYSRYLRRPASAAQVPSALAGRGLARLRAGDPAGAVEDLNESLRLQPGNFIAYWNLGLAEEARNNPVGARRAYEAFRALGGRSPEVEAALKRLARS